MLPVRLETESRILLVQLGDPVSALLHVADHVGCQDAALARAVQG